MSHSGTVHKRILAIDPTTRGFGFAVLEGPGTLVDWGVKQIRANKNARSLAEIRELIKRYEPSAIATEECDKARCRRCPRVRSLIKRIRELARARRIATTGFVWRKVKRAFSESGAITKFQVAAAIATHFPELAHHLPRQRKAWMSEDERMRIFGAVALALAAFHFARSRKADQSDELLTRIHAA